MLRERRVSANSFESLELVDSAAHGSSKYERGGNNNNIPKLIYLTRQIHVVQSVWSKTRVRIVAMKYESGNHINRGRFESTIRN